MLSVKATLAKILNKAWFPVVKTYRTASDGNGLVSIPYSIENGKPIIVLYSNNGYLSVGYDNGATIYYRLTNWAGNNLNNQSVTITYIVGGVARHLKNLIQSSFRRVVVVC